MIEPMRYPRTAALGLALGLAATAGCATRAGRGTPQQGQLTVGVSSSGPGIAALRFRVTVEPAGIDRPINADAGIFTTSTAPAGDHIVGLRDLPARCRIEGAALRDVRVGPARHPVVRFVVSCS